MAISQAQFDDPTHTPSNHRLDGDFLSPTQKRMFEQSLTQSVQNQGRKDEKARQKRKQEFLDSLRGK